MRDVEDAIVTALQADTQLAALAPGGVHKVLAPEGSPYPRVIVQVQSGAVPLETFTAEVAESGKYTVKGIVDVGNAGGMTSDCYDIEDRIHAVLQDAQLTLIGGRQLQKCRRCQRIQYPEQNTQDGTVYNHRGAVYFVFASGS